jgi:hypothetical protein
MKQKYRRDRTTYPEFIKQCGTDYPIRFKTNKVLDRSAYKASLTPFELMLKRRYNAYEVFTDISTKVVHLYYLTDIVTDYDKNDKPIYRLSHSIVEYITDGLYIYYKEPVTISTITEPLPNYEFTLASRQRKVLTDSGNDRPDPTTLIPFIKQQDKV